MSKQQMRRTQDWKRTQFKRVDWRPSDVTIEYPYGAILHWDASAGWQDQTGNQALTLIGSAYPTVSASGALNESGKEWGFDLSAGAVRTAFLAGEATIVMQVTLPAMSSLTDATDYSLWGDVLFARRDGTAGSFKLSDGTNVASYAYDWTENEVVTVVCRSSAGYLTIGVDESTLSRTNRATKSTTIEDASWTKNGGSASGSTFEKTSGASASGFLLKIITTPGSTTARLTVRASSGTVNRMTIVASDSTTFAQRGRLSCLLTDDPQNYHLYLTNIDTTHNLSVIIYVGYTNTTYNGSINVFDVCFSDCSDIRTEPFLGLIPNTGSSPISKTFSSVDITPWGNGVVVGDSILGGISTDFNVTFFGWVFGISGSVYIENKAVGGNQLSNIASALAADITGKSSVVLSGGINSVNGGVPYETMLSQMIGMIEEAKTAGLEMIVCNCNPAGGSSGWTTGKQATLEAYNSGLAAYCSESGVELVDMYTLLKNPASTALLAAYDQGDGLHPNSLGRQVIAEAVLGRITSQTLRNVGGISLSDSSLPTDGQIFKSHALPIAARKVTAFPGVASAAQINEAGG